MKRVDYVYFLKNENPIFNIAMSEKFSFFIGINKNMEPYIPSYRMGKKISYAQKKVLTFFQVNQLEKLLKVPIIGRTSTYFFDTCLVDSYNDEEYCPTKTKWEFSIKLKIVDEDFFEIITHDFEGPDQGLLIQKIHIPDYTYFLKEEFFPKII